MRQSRAILTRRKRAAALLEVVLSLGIFTVAASILFATMSRSLQASERLRNQAIATDLAVSKLSETHLFPSLVINDGPESFPDESGSDSARLDGWQWQTRTESVSNTDPDAPSMVRLTVRITHEESGTVLELSELFSESTTEMGL